MIQCSGLFQWWIYLHALQISAEFLNGFGSRQVPGARRKEAEKGRGKGWGRRLRQCR